MWVEAELNESSSSARAEGVGERKEALVCEWTLSWYRGLSG